MRGSVSTLIVFLVCLVLVLLYWFAGRPQLSRQTSSIQEENIQLTNRLAEISEMERAIPQMMQRLPEWRSKLELYRAAIPTNIDDEVFLTAVSEQLKAQDVQLLSIKLVKGGAWLGQLGEAQVEELKAKGIDDSVARKIQVAFYSVRLMGDFENVITAFENLKIHNRLFSIDQVDGPVTSGAGLIAAALDPQLVPIELTGRIYYGVPAEYLTVDQLVEVFNTAVIIPEARNIQNQIANRGAKLLTADPVAPVTEDSGEPAGPPVDDVPETTDAAPVTGDPVEGVTT